MLPLQPLRAYSVFLVWLCTAFLFFSASAQEPKGNRILAWQVDLAEDGDYNAAFSHVQEACVESVHLFVTWTSLEPDTGSFDQGFISSFLDVSNLYYPAVGVKAELQIAPVNTNNLEVPSELSSVNFDDPVMIERFKGLLDTVFAHIPDLELAALNIGNESDVYFGVDSLAYARFKVFLDAVAPHAKMRYNELHGEELNVGTTFTLEGLIHEPRKPLCAMVNATRDVVTTTYYPLNSDFTMKDPSAVGEDFADLIEVYHDTAQPIYFAECGYASSSVCNSSEAQQAAFYREVFDAWDMYADHIPYITIFKSTDWSQQEVDEFGVYYGLNDTIFLEYLRTLGVRTWPGSGSHKASYEQIRCLLDERGWCATTCVPLSNETGPNELAFTLFPNPSNGSFKVEYDSPLPAELCAFNMHGQKVLCTQVRSGQVVDLTDWVGQGMLYISVAGDDLPTWTTRLVMHPR